jgi:steroid delta-isomerase-like uncharacterized protein
MSEENKAIVRRSYEELWSKGNLDVVDEIYATDFVLHDPAQPGISDAEGYKQQVVTIRTAFPDLNIKVEDQLAEGDKVATRWATTGTHQGEFAGIPATGKQGGVTGTTIARVVGGKIVEERSNWDTLGLMQQLGVIPAPGMQQLGVIPAPGEGGE